MLFFNLWSVNLPIIIMTCDKISGYKMRKNDEKWWLLNFPGTKDLKSFLQSRPNPTTVYYSTIINDKEKASNIYI